MFDCVICALLSFHTHKVPVKSKTREPGKIIVECTSYTMKDCPELYLL